jgi:hypothetical protein
MLHRATIRLLVTLLATVSGPLAAQSVEVGGWLGWNGSSEVTTDITICTAVGCGPSATSPHRWRQAPAGALGARAELHPRVALRAEVAVVPKGYPPPTHPYVTSTYLEVPVAAELTWLRLRSADFTALAGIAPRPPAYLHRLGGDGARLPAGGVRGGVVGRPGPWARGTGTSACWSGSVCGGRWRGGAPSSSCATCRG